MSFGRGEGEVGSNFKYYSQEKPPWEASCSVSQSCPTLCDPMDCSMPGLSVPISQSLPKFMSIAPVMPSSHLMLWCPLFLLPSIFPSIRDFSNELAVCIRRPKYWSFSFSISPSNLPGGSGGKASAYSAGDPGSIPGLGRSPGEGNGNPLQYSCLENPMDGGAW